LGLIASTLVALGVLVGVGVLWRHRFAVVKTHLTAH
jgi:hypothetical protein